MNAARRKGTAWETAIVYTLRAYGWRHAERRALHGANDKGDVTGIPDVCIEAKAAKAITLAAWMDELQTEKDNADASVGALWIKRRGKAAPLDGYVVVSAVDFMHLLREAGY